jgi:hypothetical protein
MSSPCEVAVVFGLAPDVGHEFPPIVVFPVWKYLRCENVAMLGPFHAVHQEFIAPLCIDDVGDVHRTLTKGSQGWQD